MKKQLQNQRGLTIVEVVMSLAMLMIVMVSVSGLISIVLNNKQFAEQKQRGTLLGQEIIEEIQLIDTLTQTEGKYYIPLAGLNDLINEAGGDSLNGVYKGNIKELEVSLELEKSEEHLSISTYTLPNNLSDQFVIQIENEGDNFKVSNVSNGSENSQGFTLDEGDSLVIRYDESNSNKIVVSNRTGINKIESEQQVDSPEIILKFTEHFNSTAPFNLDIRNEDPTLPLNIQVTKYVNSSVKVDYNPAPIGWVKIYNNRFEGLKPIGELYNYTLQIKVINKLLFEAYGNKNFIKG